MSVSYPVAGAYVPTFSRIGITLRRRRPHESSSRPPCRPFPGAVEAGGHGGKRSKRKGPRRVEKKAPKRAEHSDFYSFNDTIMDLLHILIEMVLRLGQTPDTSSAIDRASRSLQHVPDLVRHQHRKTHSSVSNPHEPAWHHRVDRVVILIEAFPRPTSWGGYSGGTINNRSASDFLSYAEDRGGSAGDFYICD